MSRAAGTPWDELVAVALVGTERRPDLPAAVRAAAGVPAEGPVEAQVLAAAALLGGGRRAGWLPPASPLAPPGASAGRPSTGAPAGRPTAAGSAAGGPAAGGPALGAAPVAVSAPAPAAADDQPIAPDGAVQVLDLLLAGAVTVPGGPDALVAEWLGRCARRGLRLPDALVPAVLDRASTSAALRHVAGDVAAAVGGRGRWLAGLNDAWSWVADEVAVADGGDTDTGPRAAGGTRVGPGAASGRPGDGTPGPGAGAADGASALDGEPVVGAREVDLWVHGPRSGRLALLRRLRAADPEGARRLLESTWRSEAAGDRATFLQVLADGGVVPGDEPFLDAALDDRAAGVRAAAAAALDRLPTSGRAQRMAARVAPLVRSEGRVRRRLVVDLPGAPDAAARRDGIGTAGRLDRGERATWLVELVTATPLAFWPRHLGRPPADLVMLDGVPDDLLDGWARAASRQRDAAWAEALLPRRPLPELLALLDPVAAERALAPLLRPNRLTPRQLVALLKGAPAPWTPRLSRTVLELLGAAGDRVGPLLTAAPAMAAALDPSVAPDIDRWASQVGGGPAVRRDARRLHHALTLRDQIAKELP